MSTPECVLQSNIYLPVIKDKVVKDKVVRDKVVRDKVVRDKVVKDMVVNPYLGEFLGQCSDNGCQLSL